MARVYAVTGHPPGPASHRFAAPAAALRALLGTPPPSGSVSGPRARMCQCHGPSGCLARRAPGDTSDSQAEILAVTRRITHCVEKSESNVR